MRRRLFLIGGLAGGALGACTPAAGSATFVAEAAAGSNTGPDGADRPLVVQILQLKGSGAFDGADFFALQTPATALGADLVKAEALVLAPGAKVTRSIGLDPATVMIGVVAGFRDPGGKVFRAKAPVSPTASLTFALRVGPAGLTLTPAG